ncbi:MAG: hypothetical protein EA408_06625 [Marinilabiliales bacterium]|nr:MAG: hypothetical protein EA408_06625 [Marinilabiliales bacterium]
MTLKIINVAAFTLMIVMNYLANALPLGGKTTGELSAQYPNLFVPAGITFSIWGVIYLLLLLFCILQFMSDHREIVQSIGWLFAASCLLNALWIVTWHYEKMALSILVMVLLLAVLTAISSRLTGFPAGIARAAFGIYLGWICIATIANVTALLVAANWQGWGLSQETWAVVMILAGAVITILVIQNYRNPFAGLAVIWALAGIMIARWPDNRAILVVAAVSAIAVAIITVLAAVRKPAPG